MCDVFADFDEGTVEGYGSASPDKKMKEEAFKFEAKTEEEKEGFDKVMVISKDFAVAEELSNRDHHSLREQNNVEKRVLDSTIGKAAEIFFWKYYRDIVKGLRQTDLKVYVSDFRY